MRESRHYRLLQVDKDQNKTIFKTIYVNCDEHKNEFKFYPNPAKDEIQLAISVAQEINDGILSITDQFGKTHLSGYLDLKKGANLIPLQINLPAGIYFIS